MAPNPPVRDSVHQYYIEVYLQPRRIASLPQVQRTRFPIDSFIRQHGLQRIGQEVVYADPSHQVFYVGESQVTVNAQHEFIRPDTNLDEREQAFCSCVVQVAAKQPGACNLEKAWFEERNGETCKNPFAICANSVGTTSRDCMSNYDFDFMNEQQLQSLAYLHNKQVSDFIIDK